MITNNHSNNNNVNSNNNGSANTSGSTAQRRNLRSASPSLFFHSPSSVVPTPSSRHSNKLYTVSNKPSSTSSASSSSTSSTSTSNNMSVIGSTPVSIIGGQVNYATNSTAPSPYYVTSPDSGMRSPTTPITPRTPRTPSTPRGTLPPIHKGSRPNSEGSGMESDLNSTPKTSPLHNNKNTAPVSPPNRQISSNNNGSNMERERERGSSGALDHPISPNSAEKKKARKEKRVRSTSRSTRERSTSFPNVSRKTEPSTDNEPHPSASRPVSQEHPGSDPGTPHAPKEKKSIKNYKKGELIGQGANGKVYMSFDADNCQFFAVKEVTFANVPPHILEEVCEFRCVSSMISNLHLPCDSNGNREMNVLR